MQKSQSKGVFSFWTIILFLVLAFIVFIPALNEYYSSKRDLIKLWNEQGQLLSETILRSAARFSTFDREAQDVSDKRLIDLGHYVRQMDSLHFPDKIKVTRYARGQADIRTIFCDADGNIYGKRFPKIRRQLQSLIIEFIKTHAFDKPVMILPLQPEVQNIPPGVIIDRARNDEYIVLIPPLRKLAARMGRRPLQRWIEHLTQNSSIEYIALFKRQSILGHSGEIPAEIFIPDTPFPNWSIREQTDKNIFEYTRREPGGVGVLIGLSTEALQRLQKNLIKRLIISSILILILGAVLFTYIIKRHSYGLLKQKYAQMQTYSGSILENMDEAIIMLDEDDRISIFNKAAEKLFDLKVEQVRYKTLAEIALPLPSDLVLDFLSAKSFLEKPVIYTGSGGQRQLLISARPLSYMDDDLAPEKQKMYLIFIHDNTGRRELEEMRSRKNKLMAMGELASRMAHEIRNPLNGIGMLAQRLSREFQPKEEEREFEQMTGSIRSESVRINEIVETFLSYARNPEFKFRKVNLKEMIQDNAHLLRSLGPATLEFELEEHCDASIDPDQFKQALINLVKNAFDVSPEGSIIRIKLQHFEEKVFLFVEDQGPGIAPEIKEKIFDLYFTTKTKGMGLGLSIVEKIISAHGGEVQVETPYYLENKKQRGTRFILEMPVVKSD